MNEERTAAADVCKFASGDRVVESDVRSDGGVPNPVRHLKFKFALEHGLLALGRQRPHRIFAQFLQLGMKSA